MNLDEFDKEKRAALQRQAYGKVYALCSECNMPLIPISKISSDKNLLYEAQFIKCCSGGTIVFNEEQEFI